MIDERAKENLMEMFMALLKCSKPEAELEITMAEIDPALMKKYQQAYIIFDRVRNGPEPEKNIEILSKSILKLREANLNGSQSKPSLTNKYVHKPISEYYIN